MRKIDKNKLKVDVLAFVFVVFVLGYLVGARWVMNSPDIQTKASHRPLSEEGEACVMDDAYRLIEQWKKN